MKEDNLSSVRERMVEQQLVPRGIHDPRVLEAFKKVPRHRFVGPDFENAAYEDYPLPCGEGQTISQPYIVALMTECLELKDSDRVLEIGTGSGYQTAILAGLAGEVYTIERLEPLSKKAEAILTALGYNNIHFLVGDGTRGWEEQAHYDGILVAAGSPDIPEPLKKQMADGGRLVIPVGGRWSQELLVVRRSGDKYSEERVCGCVFVPLLGEFGWKT